MKEINYKIEILEQAVRLFKEDGVKFTLDTIAKNLKISKKTLYKYYTGKENILYEAVDKFFDTIIVSHNMILKENINLLDKLEKVVTAYPEFYGIEDYRVSEIEATYPAVFHRIVERLEANWDLTFELLDECKNKGLIIEVNNAYLRMMLIALFENVLRYKNQKKVLVECISYIFRGIIAK